MATAEIGGDHSVEGVLPLEHTADAGVAVVAGSLGECLARAAAGMFAQVWARPSVPPVSEQEVVVELEAENAGELLVAWLEELLYHSEVRGVCFYRFEVQTQGWSLLGRATGASMGEAVEVVGPMVKAVTRHGLEVAEVDGSWRASVFFDV